MTGHRGQRLGLWDHGGDWLRGAHSATSHRFGRRIAAWFVQARAAVARGLCIWLLASLAMVGGAASRAHAQEATGDLTELSLEQLLEVEVGFLDVNVIGGHTHRKGEWMVGYEFMFMDMDGNRDGTHHVSTGDILKDFNVAPTKMHMETQMFELMYSPSDDLSFMAMLPIKSMSMDHVTRAGERFRVDVDGMGDVSLLALWTVYRTKDQLKDHCFTGLLDQLDWWMGMCPQNTQGDYHQIFLQGGLSLPTGSIDELSDPEYMMQLGSGTVDLLPGITYLGHTKDWGWGVHGDGTLRMGENEHLYALGNRYDVTAWLTRKWADWLTSSVRLDWQHWGDIRGADARFDPMDEPTANPDLRGGDRLDLLFSLTLYQPKGHYKGNRLGVEFGFPLWQSLQGPQLETDWQLKATWSWTFGPLEQKR